ncbi:hypothetical protein K438DRAFT_1943228 [Mycena galopus ATCC 62051]|nr:hypothetical protein K438DRAFT_1943228 [Mycena galopus ATCC 62051]
MLALALQCHREARPGPAPWYAGAYGQSSPTCDALGLAESRRVARRGVALIGQWYSGGLGLYSLSGHSKDKSQLVDLARAKYDNRTDSEAGRRSLTTLWRHPVGSEGSGPPDGGARQRDVLEIESRDERMWHEEKPNTNRRPRARMPSDSAK